MIISNSKMAQHLLCCSCLETIAGSRMDCGDVSEKMLTFGNRQSTHAFNPALRRQRQPSSRSREKCGEYRAGHLLSFSGSLCKHVNRHLTYMNTSKRIKRDSEGQVIVHTLCSSAIIFQFLNENFHSYAECNSYFSHCHSRIPTGAIGGEHLFCSWLGEIQPLVSADMEACS